MNTRTITFKYDNGEIRTLLLDPVGFILHCWINGKLNY